MIEVIGTFMLFVYLVSLSWRHVREVLEDDPGRFEWDLHTVALTLLPVENVFHIVLENLELITVTYGWLQQHPDGKRQLFCINVNDLSKY